MGLFSVRRPQRAILITAACILVFVVLHQVSYLADTIFSGFLSDSIDILRPASECTPHAAADSRPAADDAIPNIIHQIWKTADVRTYSAEASRSSWKDIAEPLNYTVKLWTEEDVVRLVARNYAWLLPTYRGYTWNIQRADIARLAVLHAEGGIYADLDVYPNHLDAISCLRTLGYEATFAPTAGTSGISNHFFMAERGSEALEWAMHEADWRAAAAKRILLPYLQVFWSTGPIMVTSALVRYAGMNRGKGHTVAVLDDKYVREIVRHSTGRSWHGPDGRLLNYLADQTVSDWLWIAVYLSVAGFCLAGLIAVARRGAAIGTRLARLKAL